MRLKAYILAADPAWIELSVNSYYHLVEEIVVSYDRKKCGWTGAPIAVDECLERLQLIDVDKKIKLCPGDYSRSGYSPMENDTYQRQCALREVGQDVDWVLQLDTDEVLPNPEGLIETLRRAEQEGIPAVEWPMRVLFRQLPDGCFLEVCAANGADRFEYPGPIAVRPNVTFVDARRTSGSFLRPVVKGDDQSLQVRQNIGEAERRLCLDDAGDAILHNSWARSPSSIRSKIASWSHNEGLRSKLFYYLRWLPAPYLWRSMRNFHPFAGELWPALKLCSASLLPDSAKCREKVA